MEGRPNTVQQKERIIRPTPCDKNSCRLMRVSWLAKGRSASRTASARATMAKLAKRSGSGEPDPATTLCRAKIPTSSLSCCPHPRQMQNPRYRRPEVPSAEITRNNDYGAIASPRNISKTLSSATNSNVAYLSPSIPSASRYSMVALS